MCENRTEDITTPLERYFHREKQILYCSCGRWVYNTKARIISIITSQATTAPVDLYFISVKDAGTLNMSGEKSDGWWRFHYAGLFMENEG